MARPNPNLFPLLINNKAGTKKVGDINIVTLLKDSNDDISSTKEVMPNDRGVGRGVEVVVGSNIEVEEQLILISERRAF